MADATANIQQLLSTQSLTLAASSNPQHIAWDIDSQAFESVFQQLLINGQDAPVRLMLIQSRSIVAQSLARKDPLIDHSIVLDRLISMAALTVQLSKAELFSEIITALHRIYEVPITSDGLSTKWPHGVVHELWENVLIRLYGLGGLVVRLERWEFLPLIFDKKVRGETNYQYGNWIRHGITMAAQSRPYPSNSVTPEFNPIASATTLTASTQAVRPESFDDEDHWLSSICQFDFLNCVYRQLHDRRDTQASYYPSFAIYRSSRTEPIAVRLITDTEMRGLISPVASERLASALEAVGELAERVSTRINGWSGYYDPSIRTMISSKHFPE
jgi:hypothetical protein